MKRLMIVAMTLLFAGSALAGMDAVEKSLWPVGDALCDIVNTVSTGRSNGVGYDHRSRDYAGGEMLYYTNWDDRYIHQVDPRTGADVALYPCPGQSSPSGVAVIDDEQGCPNAMLAQNDFSEQLCHIVDLFTGTDISSFATPYGNEGLAYDMNNNWLWMGVYDTGQIEAYDLAGVFQTSISSPEGDGADGLAWSPGYLYAMCYSGNMYKYDFASSTWTLLCYHPGTGGWDGLADDGNYLWDDATDPTALNQIDRECCVFIDLEGPTEVYAGDKYTFTATVHNYCTTSKTVDIWTEAWLPNGKYWKGNPHIKVTITLPPDKSKTVTKSFTVHPKAPKGCYNYRGQVGYDDDLWNAADLVFEVK
jgi:hypothetical protein